MVRSTQRALLLHSFTRLDLDLQIGMLNQSFIFSLNPVITWLTSPRAKPPTNTLLNLLPSSRDDDDDDIIMRCRSVGGNGGVPADLINPVLHSPHFGQQGKVVHNSASSTE